MAEITPEARLLLVKQIENMSSGEPVVVRLPEDFDGWTDSQEPFDAIAVLIDKEGDARLVEIFPSFQGRDTKSSMGATISEDGTFDHVALLELSRRPNNDYRGEFQSASGISSDRGSLILRQKFDTFLEMAARRSSSGPGF